MGVQYGEYTMQHIIESLLNLIIPPHDDVRMARSVSESALRETIRLKTGALPWITAAFPYRHKEIRALIRANKFYGDRHAARLLGICIIDTLIAVLEEEPADGEILIIPIPSSPKRKRVRGYNQVERILKTQGGNLSSIGTYRTDILKRVDRESQTHVTRESRKKNITDAFYVPHHMEALVRDTVCVLVDDVSETGNTLADAKRALINAGARRVIGVVVAQ